MLEGAWARTWALTAALVVLAIGLLETAMRSYGIRPSVEGDSASLWAFWRDHVEDGDHLVVVIGSSRAQLGIDLGELGVIVKGDCIQLAVDGSGSMSVLEDVSTSTLTRSIVICELNPAVAFDDARGEDKPREHINYRARREAWRNAEVVLESAVRMRLVALRPALPPLAMSRFLRPVTWDDFLPLATLPTRQRLADYTSVDCEAADLRWALQKRRIRNAAGTFDLSRIARALTNCVTRLREQGTSVVFLRMPSSGLTKEAEDIFAPRAETWDWLAAEVDAPFIHFEDEPELRSFRCAEGSHLDATTAREFTKGLVQVLRRRGLLLTDD